MVVLNLGFLAGHILEWGSSNADFLIEVSSKV
jgi:hypothetical protein